MDNNQQNMGNLPPGYSANDIITNNQANSQPLTNNGSLPPGYTAADIIHAGGAGGGGTMPPPQEKPESSLSWQSGDDLATKAAKAGLGVLSGIGEGVFGTVAGGADIVNKITGQAPGAITQSLHELAGDNEQQSTAENIGQGAETIGEFILGDLAAVKGLSMADKLSQSAKVMKTLENFPRLQNALRLGINIGKAGTELSPEERQILQNYPKIAKLVGVGSMALRQGAVQGVQTELKTGGDTGEALKQGAEMGVGSAAIGAPLAMIGHAAEAGAKAAKTAGELQEAAKNAPTAVEANQALESKVKGAMQPTIDAAQAAKEEAEGKLTGASSALSKLEAPTKEEIAAKAESHIKSAHDALGKNYEKAIDAVKSDIGDHTIDYHDTTLKDTVQHLLGESEKNKEYLPAQFDVPTPLTANVKSWLEKKLAHYGEVPEIGADGKEKFVPVATPMTLDDLLDTAKKLKHNIRNTSFLTPEGRADRDAYFKLLDGVHDAMGQLAEDAGKPEAYQAIKNANSAYKTGIQRFDNPDVKALLANKNENAVIKALSGGNSVKDIKTIKETIGPKAFASLSDDAMSRLAADSINPQTGQFDLKAWVRNMNRIPQSVRQEMLEGTTKGGALENILRQVQNVQGSGTIENADKSIKAAEDTMKSILGNTADLQGLLKQPEKVQQLQQIIGPEAMGELGDTILQNQLKQSATRMNKFGETSIHHIDTDHFLRFIQSLKDSPEVVEAFFKPTPEREAAYQQLLKSVNNVNGVKNMIKIGVIAPTLGGVTGGVFGHSVLTAILGTMAAEGVGLSRGSGYFGSIRDFLDDIASHPAVWKTLKGAGKIAGSETGKGAAYLARVAAGKAASPSLKSILGGTQTQLSNQ